MAVGRISADEFLGALETLGWTQSGLAKRLGVHRNAVGKWVRNEAVPRYAAEYVGLVLRLREIEKQARI